MPFALASDVSAVENFDPSILQNPSLATFGSAIIGISTAEITDDPGYEGLYKYKLIVLYKLNDFETAPEAEFVLDIDLFPPSCNSGSVLFNSPAGVSFFGDSEEDMPDYEHGHGCVVEYDGAFDCDPEPTLNTGEVGATVTFSSIPGECVIDDRGVGVFYYYSAVEPGGFGLFRKDITINADGVSKSGPVIGVLPEIDGDPGVEVGQVLISEFLVKPKPGDQEFIEIVNTLEEPVNVDNWEVVVDGGVIPLEGNLESGTLDSLGAFIPNDNIFIDFDNDPSENPIPAGTPLDNVYEPWGVTFSADAFNLICDGVFANDQFPNFSTQFGSEPNVVSMCQPEIPPDFSENNYGVIRAELARAAFQVCIDVWTLVESNNAAVVRGYDVQGELIEEVVTQPGFRGEVCITGPGVRSLEFAGFGFGFAVFDNLDIFFEEQDIIVEGAPREMPIGLNQRQEEDEGFIPDKGGFILLIDDNGVVQDSVPYGNIGGAPISSPLIIPAGSPPPPGFEAVFPGRVSLDGAALSTEDDTASTSTQRIDDTQNSGNAADDFNAGAPTPNESNGATSPELGSSVRLNSLYAFSFGNDAIGLFNPLSELIDIQGWHISDGSVTQPLFPASEVMQIPFGSELELLQNALGSFTFELEFDDVLYLYDENLVRLDQIGWSQFPTFFPDSCLLRTPSGVGPADGYDFQTSGGSIGLLIYDNCGLQSPTVNVGGPTAAVTQLAAPFPNPALQNSIIEFTLAGGRATTSRAELSVYDVSGRRIRTLLSGDVPPGQYRAEWNGLSESGARVGAGVYFVQLRVNGQKVAPARAIVRLE